MSEMKQSNYILNSGVDREINELGGKAWALNQLQDAGFEIPAWFVITPAAFYDSLGMDKLEAFSQFQDEKKIGEIIEQLKMSGELQDALISQVKKFCPNNEWLAVRSSAVDEDGMEYSFAGQLDSFLFVGIDDLVNKVIAVWQSGFSPRILQYRKQNKLGLIPHAPAVLIQHMVNADVSGVAFSANPVNGRRKASVINAVFGLADALVSGAAEGDYYSADLNNTVLERQIATKKSIQQFNSQGGVCTVPMPDEKQNLAVLNDQQIKQVVALARQAEFHFGRPQDIEWAIENNHLYLLQSRPITTLENLVDPDGDTIIWDNSNIVESYSGVTTPLTYTFIRRAYESVYIELVRILGVRDKLINENRHVFANMVGLIEGRVYYNLLSWYRALALLPGFSLNRGFMEQMMGVKEELPESVFGVQEKLSLRKRLCEIFNLSYTVIGLISNHFTLEKKIERFYQCLSSTLTSPETLLEEMREDQLVAYYNQLEQKLLTRWDAPLINDLFAMVFYGTLKKLVSLWCENDESLQNDLLTGEGGMISAEPAQRVREMALVASEDGNFVTVLITSPLKEIERWIVLNQEFEKQYHEYLQRFGDRCLGELKLESITLTEEPLLLLRSVGHLASRKEKLRDTSDEYIAQRQQAEIKAKNVLKSKPVRGLFFRWILKHARARVRDRENLRFERTRVFGQVRRIFLALGKRFYAQNLISHPRDIFYLEIHEVIGVVEGTATTLSLKELIKIREKEYQNYEKSTSPPDERFVTRGGVHFANLFKSTSNDMDSDETDLKGIACCPGKVKGIARVISSPLNAELKPDEILVAEFTDPGWIMLFASAAGIIVERGSLLSHSAIVAREMNIPAIVSVNAVTKIIKDGDLIEMDGSTGNIYILAERQLVES